MNDLLNSLNARQKEAVTLPIGPSLIWAGPGSGKTRVLAHRVAYLMHILKVPKGSILAVTFTNKAANEMKERVQSLVENGAGSGRSGNDQDNTDLTVGTFHSICARILRDETESTPYKPNWTILDAEDQNVLLESILMEERGNWPFPFPVPKSFDLKTAISNFKNRCIEPKVAGRTGTADMDQNRRYLYGVYQQRLLEYNAMDFDDLLMQTKLLFQNHGVVLEKYRQQWPCVLVDEFQDTNQIQYDILKQLTLYGNSPQHLYAVGDEDQSIYGFRGAQYENLRSFAQDFQRPRTVYLEQNYRSTPQILAVANGLIRRNTQREAKILHSGQTPDTGTQPILRDADNEYNEADWIGRATSMLLDQNDYRPKDITIMYRTNAQSGPIEEALIRQRIPYRVVGASKFYERMEVKDALAHLRLIANPQDFMSLTRIMHCPPRDLSADVPQQLHECSLRWKLSLEDTLAVVCRGADTEEGIASLSAFTRHDLMKLQKFEELLQQWRIDLAHNKRYSDPGEFLAYVCKSSGYFAYLTKEFGDGRDRVDNVRQLMAIASQRKAESWPNDAGPSSLDSFLVHVSLVASQDELADQQEKVNLMTLHTAKGLEFPAVFIAGLEENTLPFYYSVKAGTKKAIEEERRLLYVGVTRAMELLLLSWARERGRLPRQASRFLAEMPDDALYREEGASWHSEDNRVPISSHVLRARTQAADTYRAKPKASRIESQGNSSIFEPNTVAPGAILGKQARSPVVKQPKNRQTVRKPRSQPQDAILKELEIGEIREGVVSSLANFGAFVNIGGADGLIHISELSWAKTNHPADVLNVGQQIQVKVISVEKERKRIGLSLRQLQPRPWDTLADRYREGDLVRAVITRIKDFGAFARLVGEPVEGLIHISEMSHEHVAQAQQVVTIGEEYEVKIIRLDIQRRRMGLSIKQADLDWAMAPEEHE